MKKVSRVLTAVAAVAVTGMALAGCTSPGATSSGGSTEKVTLTMLDHYDSPPMSTGLGKLIDKWNKAHPNIQVKQQVVQFNDLLQTINVRQSGGQGADILSAYALWGGQLAAGGVLAKPPADVAQDIKANYNPTAASAVTGSDGTYFGYPTELTDYALFYNKSLLAKAGYTQPPKDWNELKTMASKLTIKDSSGNYKQLGISLIQDGDNETAHPFLSFLNAAGGKFIDSSGKSLMGSSAQDVMEMESSLAKSGATTTSIMPTKAFPSGTVAMAIQAGWWLGSLKTQMKDKYKDVGVAPVPGPNSGDVGSLAYGFFMGVGANSPHKADAWKFLKWLNSQETSSGVTEMGQFIANLGEIPARLGDEKILEPEQAKTDSNIKVFYDVLTHAIAEPGNIKNAYKDKTDLHEALMKILVKHAPAASTFSALQDTINSNAQ